MTLHENTLEPHCSIQIHISRGYKFMPAQDLSTTKSRRGKEKGMVAVLEMIHNEKIVELCAFAT
jgi:hypothetical protein